MKQYLEALGVMVLVLAGLGGITYNVFRTEGWGEKALGKAFLYAMESPPTLVFLIGAGICIALWWRHDRITRGSSRKAPTYVLYAVMAAGAYFLGKLALLYSV